MPDFSDRYKKVLEYQEISPDFKERTAKLMKELRDGEELVPQTAEDEPRTASFTVSGNEDNFPRRINRLKVISAMAAAAACLTVGVALNRAGVFDRDNEPAVVHSDSIVTEATDSMETFVEETSADNADEAADISAPEENIDLIEHSYDAVEAASESFSEEPDSGEEAETGPVVGGAVPFMEKTAPLMEEPVYEEEPYLPEAEPPIPSSAAGTQGYDHISEEENQWDGGAFEETAPVTEAPVEASLVTGSPVEAAVPETKNSDPAENVLQLEPFSEEAEEIPDSEEFDEDTEEAVEDDTPAGNADLSRSSDFSPRRAVAGFPAQTSSVLITPSFEDTISEDGTVVKYQSKRIRSVTKLLELNKEMYAYTEEDIAAVSDEAPSDSRYIIDYAGEQGNAMRIYIGSRYICFAYEGGFYTYELTEEEYKALDSSLFGLVS